VSVWRQLHISTSEDGHNSQVEIRRHSEGKYKVHSYALIQKHKGGLDSVCECLSVANTALGNFYVDN
jgi:hypothetical protein